jgi:hypothetical protein
MKLTLPSLHAYLYQKTGSKNIIRHLSALQRSIPLNISKEDRFYLIIEDNGIEACFTTKEAYIPDGIEYALITNILPSKQRFEDGKMIIKGWAKHPL